MGKSHMFSYFKMLKHISYCCVFFRKRHKKVRACWQKTLNLFNAVSTKLPCAFCSVFAQLMSLCDVSHDHRPWCQVTSWCHTIGVSNCAKESVAKSLKITFFQPDDLELWSMTFAIKLIQGSFQGSFPYQYQVLALYYLEIVDHLCRT